jgi:ADP-ribose pyrophosphatase
MEILDVTKLTDERWLNLFAATYRHDGRTGRWLFASRRPDPIKTKPTVDAVVVVPILRDGDGPPRLVLLREYRVPIADYVYSFPAGLPDPGESLEAAARRELREETGLEVTRVKRMGPPIYPTLGVTDEAIALVFVDARATAEGKQCLDVGEVIEVLQLDYDEVCGLCDAPGQIDAKAWLVLFLYQQLGRLE